MPARLVCAVVETTVLPEALMLSVAVHCKRSRQNLGTHTKSLSLLTDMELRESLDVTGRRVKLDRAKVAVESRNHPHVFSTTSHTISLDRLPCYLDLPLRREILEVLVAERDDLPFGDEERELIEARAVELADLHATHLRAEVRRDLLQLHAGLEQVGLRGVGAQPRVTELCGHETCEYANTWM